MGGQVPAAQSAVGEFVELRPQPKLENDAPLHKSRISAGIGRFCDLDFIVEPEAAETYFDKAGMNSLQKGEDACFRFAFEALDTNHADWPEKHGLLELAIDGGNMETELFYLELEIDGPGIPTLPAW